MASYPAAIKTFSAIVNGVTKLVAALFNSPYDEITAIQTELGTDPAGTKSDLKERLAVFLNNDGTPKNSFGSWVDKSASYGAQQAASDGFVTVMLVHGTANTTPGYASCYTDVNADPTTLRQKVGVSWNGDAAYPISNASCIFPVKKSDYWKIVMSSTSDITVTVYWIPAGS